MPGLVKVLPHPVIKIIDDTHIAIADSLKLRFMVFSPEIFEQGWGANCKAYAIRVRMINLLNKIIKINEL
jgi:hypothetical protein